MWTKVSICLFLLRIAINKKLTRPLQWGVVALIVSNIILTLCWILQCRPVRAAWDTTIESQCFSRGQKQRVILAQASGTPSKTNIRHECTNSFHSHFSDLRFYLRECSHTAIVERADQVEKKNWLELSNGVRCNVLTARPNILALLIKWSSTGACCIVRTVLNFQAIPTDVSCKLEMWKPLSRRLTIPLDGGIPNWFWRL